MIEQLRVFTDDPVRFGFPIFPATEWHRLRSWSSLLDDTNGFHHALK